MKNQIKTIWHDREYKAWQEINNNLISRKVYLAALAAGAGPAVAAAAAAEDQKPQIVLEYIFRWNITWWQNN